MNSEDLQDDYVKLLETADLWMFRAKASFRLLQYFNSISYPGTTSWTDEDLKKEVESQANRLMKMHKDGITWQKSAMEEINV